MKERTISLLFELLRNSNRSDRELAKALGVSQPTVTRTRRKLVQDGFIREYTVIPDFEKLGYEIISLTFLKFKEAEPQLIKKAREWAKKQPCIVFASDGEGVGMNSVMISVHENYSGFSTLISDLRQEWQPYLTDIQSFMISVNRKELLVKPFSLRYLAKTEKETE